MKGEVVQCKFSRNTAPEGFGAICEGFRDDCETMDHFKMFEKMINQLQLTGRIWKKTVEYQGKEMNQGTMLCEVLREWFWRFMRKVDAEIVQKIAHALKVSTLRRTKIVDTVHDFSKKYIPQNIIESLKLGSNYVVHTNMNESDARLKMEGELLSYLVKYRRYIENKESILKDSLNDWLAAALNNTDCNTVHHEFYSSLLCHSKISMGVGKRVQHGNKPEFKKLDSMGVVVVEADKGMGICLLNIEDLVKADKAMVTELKGLKLTGKNSDGIKAELHEVAILFESDLDVESKRFLNTYYGERMVNIIDSELPFLKVRPKLHKLTSPQLERKDSNDLKYRPVIDASRTPLRSYAKCLMGYLRDLIRRVDDKFFNGNGTMLKNGHEMRSIIDKLNKSDEKRKYFAIADLSSAYTFIYLENLMIAMNFLGGQLGIPEWKIRFQEKVATIVLNNSIIETTEGLFKMGNCLPMGLCTSGECMDVVLLLSELVLLGKIKAENIPGYLQQYGENKPESMMENTAFLTYKRYRDDTFSCLSREEDKSFIDPLNLLGRTFLPTLDINIELTMFVGTFLDLKFYKRFSGQGMETLVKRKGNFPITFCHGSSNTNNSIVKSIVNGEVLRHRRLTSSRILQVANDECLILELISRGYSKDLLRKIVQERIVSIGEQYNQNFVRRKGRENPEGLVYGAVSIYDEEWNTHYKVHRLLKQCLPNGVR